MLAAMVGASETSEVAGFGSEPWPGVRNVLGPIPIARVGKEAESWVGYEDVASVIGGWGEGGKK